MLYHAENYKVVKDIDHIRSKMLKIDIELKKCTGEIDQIEPEYQAIKSSYEATAEKLGKLTAGQTCLNTHSLTL